MRRRTALLAVCALAACQRRTAVPQSLPLPVLPGNQATLRVLHLVNPRFEALSPASLAVLRDALRDTVARHFGITLAFEGPETGSVADAMHQLPGPARQRALADTLPPGAAAAHRPALLDAYRTALAQGADAAERGAVALHLGAPALADDPAGLARHMLDTQLDGFARWSALRAADGEPWFGPDGLHAYALWNARLRHGLPADLVLTNQPICSLERLSPSPHTALRGGYTLGLSERNPQSRYGTSAVWSTLAFTPDAEPWPALRDGERYGANEAARLAGTAAAHEIGHVLLHLGHPFGHPACAMAPVPGLAFRRWAAQLDAAACPLGSSAAMTPGAIRIAAAP